MGTKKTTPIHPTDSALFHETLQDVVPRHDDRVEPYRSRLPPLPRPPQQQPALSAEKEAFVDLAVETTEELLFVRPGVQQRLMRELRRGKITPGDCLDLHGLRVKGARIALLRFLQQALERQLRCIRIIHGKGRGSAESQPVLKQKTNQWLRQKKEVLAFCSAPGHDGGTGASYVLLSRKREAASE